MQKATTDKIQYCVFGGGGAKGAIYSGAYSALTNERIVAGLEGVAGSSAGAISAAFIACGVDVKEFTRLSRETDFTKLLGGGFIVHKDGIPLYDLIRKTISHNIYKYLKNNDDPEFVDLKKRSFDNGIITFADLAKLRELDPVVFKDLVITATNKTEGVLELFNNTNTPDVEIALACRASASIPLFFQEVIINGKTYVDGGYLNNIPTDAFADDISSDPQKLTESKTKGRTLALAFGGNMEADVNVAIYSAREKIIDPNFIIKFLAAILKRLSQIGGHTQYFEEENKTNQRLRDNAHNVIGLDPQGVGVLSFETAAKKADYLNIKGEIQTDRWLINHDFKTEEKSCGLRELLLATYEKSQTKRGFGGWKDAIVQGKDAKLVDLLEFCKAQKWQGVDLNTNLKEFIEVAATSRTHGKLTNDTHTIKAFIDVSNDAYTPNAVRSTLIQLLEIDQTKDPRFDKTKTLNQNLDHFKFTQKGFDKLLSKMQNEKDNKSFADKTALGTTIEQHRG